MKKLLLALALMVPMLAFTGCGGGEDEPDNGSLNKTKWVMSSIGGARYAYNVFEFSKTSFENYSADENLTPLGESTNGTYSINGSEVDFNGFIMRAGLFQEVKFDKGTINGDKMTFHVKVRSYDPKDKNGNWSDWPNAVILIKR